CRPRPLAPCRGGRGPTRIPQDPGGGSKISGAQGVFCCFASPSLINSPLGKKFDFLSIPERGIAIAQSPSGKMFGPNAGHTTRGARLRSILAGRERSVSTGFSEQAFTRSGVLRKYERRIRTYGNVATERHVVRIAAGHGRRPVRLARFTF